MRELDCKLLLQHACIMWTLLGVYIYIYIYIYKYKCVSVCVIVCVCSCLCVCVHVCVCMHVCMNHMNHDIFIFTTMFLSFSYMNRTYYRWYKHATYTVNQCNLYVIMYAYAWFTYSCTLSIQVWNMYRNTQYVKIYAFAWSGVCVLYIYTE